MPASRTAVRPARQRFILDGREPDGMLAIARDHAVAEASKRFGLSEPWIGAVLHVESGGKLQARSQKGAIGLMQFMPKTWTELTRSLWFRR
jgi:soluble lytic murein transglycosylase-like protein